MYRTLDAASSASERRRRASACALVLAAATCALACGRPRSEQTRRKDVAPPRASSVAPAPPRPTPTLPTGFRHARAFVFNRDPKAKLCESILAADGSLCRSAKVPGVALSGEQVERAIAAFGAPPPDLDTAPWCFEPHHGVVLYDDADRPIAGMSICFECQRAALWPLPRGLDPQALSPSSERAFRRLLCEELGLSACSEVGEHRR
jgi:hypothetical protein